MKLSLAWIFSHIEANWQDQSIEHIVSTFNQVTAEIERYWHVSYDMSSFAMARVQSIEADAIQALVPEWNIAASLSLRSDAHALAKDACFMVRRSAGGAISWATYADFDNEKTGLLPAFMVPESLLLGLWKEQFESQDIIIEVDNKSLTHRPDMWGHRGFAREIAAFLNLPFIPESACYEPRPMVSYSHESPPLTDMPLLLRNEASSVVDKFSGFYAAGFSNTPSHPFIASRLIKVGSRAIDGIVDLTNYVMLDWSQPLHAFDAAAIEGSQVVARFALPTEKLELLDDSAIQLSKDDLVICSSKAPMALAGIMGGKSSAVQAGTTAIFVEAAHFSPEIIRKSALRHKTRTEASARFEKNIDPMQTTAALQRFMHLAFKYGMLSSDSTIGPIVSLGEPGSVRQIVVAHSYLQERAGFSLTSDQVIKPLSRIGFEIALHDESYTITVPSFRATKDIEAPEDILEEVVRFFGFNNIVPVLPSMQRPAFDLTNVMGIRAIKRFLQTAVRMTEQCNYSLFDEAMLAKIQWQPVPESLAIINPISTQSYRLATSLIPGLLKNILDNYAQSDQLKFFELAPVWNIHSAQVHEQQKIAGIFFSKRGNIDFYACKQHIIDLYAFARLAITWHKPAALAFPWMSRHQSAVIRCDGNDIGYISKLDPLFLSRLDVLDESQAFVFELDLVPLLAMISSIPQYRPLSKYQDSHFDLGFMVPLALDVATIEAKLLSTSILVQRVELIDFFEKESWQDMRALTFHVVVAAHDRVLVREEIDQAREQLVASVVALGATLRG